jgi:hypothetical protein
MWSAYRSHGDCEGTKTSNSFLVWHPTSRSPLANFKLFTSAGIQLAARRWQTLSHNNRRRHFNLPLAAGKLLTLSYLHPIVNISSFLSFHVWMKVPTFGWHSISDR